MTKCVSTKRSPTATSILCYRTQRVMADAMDVRLARLKELEALEAQGSDETSSEEDDDTSDEEGDTWLSSDDALGAVRLAQEKAARELWAAELDAAERDKMERLRAKKAEQDKMAAGLKMVTADSNKMERLRAKKAEQHKMAAGPKMVTADSTTQSLQAFIKRRFSFTQEDYNVISQRFYAEFPFTVPVTLDLSPTKLLS